MTKTYDRLSTFANKSFDLNKNYSFLLELDKNKLTKAERLRITELVVNLKQFLKTSHPEIEKNIQFVMQNKHLEKEKFNFTIRND